MKNKTFSRIFNVVGNEHKNQLFGLIFLLVISAFVELVSIGIIIPIIEILSNPEKLSNYHFMGEIFRYGGNFVYTAAAIFLIIYIIKNLYLLWFSYFLNTALEKMQHTIATRLFHNIIFSDYLKLTSYKKTDLINTMSGELNALVGGYISPFASLISEFLVTFLLICLLFWYDPSTAIYVILLNIIVSLLLIFLLRKKITEWGLSRQIESENMIEGVNNSIDGIKEVKIHKREHFALKKHSIHVKSFVNVNKKISVANSLPKYILEIVAIVSLLFVVLITYFERGIESILPIFALYAAAAYRIMPSFNRIITYINQIKFNYPSIDKVSSLFQDLSNKKEEFDIDIDKPQGYKIMINNLVFGYSDASNLIDNVSFSINENEKIGIIGASGAGKTTLIHCILGLIKPTMGSVLVGGLNPEKINNSIFSYVSQNVFIAHKSILENVALNQDYHEININLVKSSLEKSGLQEYVNSLPLGIHTILGDAGSKISGGQKQRIGIARALYNQSKIIVLDEATSALDYKTEHNIVQSIYDAGEGKTLIIIAHRISTLKDCDKVIFLKDGKIFVSGTYDEVVHNCDEVKNITKYGKL
jgi:ATP-binding cassette, subfamily B, bacterial PglK